LLRQPPENGLRMCHRPELSAEGRL